MRRTELALGIAAVFLVGALVGILLDSGRIPGLGSRTPEKVEEALALIRQRYVDELSGQELAEAAIGGMVDLLDPYSTYIDARTIGPIQDELEGEFGGVGIWFEMVSDSARVVSVIAGGPSERLGVRPGDRIVAVDDSSCVGEPSLSIQRRIRGRAGEPVGLTIFRPLLRQQFTVQLERAIIPIRSVEAAFRLDAGTGYLRITRFTTGTADEFRQAVESLTQERPLSRILIDVRDNPGGILEAAVQVADEILPAGLDIVSTEGRGVEEREVYASTSGGLLEEIPVIALVNGNSASASEILAGALQDTDRGLVVGRPTFGKGLVQRQFMFSDGSALHLTVARYFTPAGRPIQNSLDRDVATQLGSMQDSEVPSHADSLVPFHTLHGRELTGGKGIYPDQVVPTDTTVGPFELVYRTGLDLGFSRGWFDRHESELRRTWVDHGQEFADEFVVSDAMWADFLAYAREQAGEVWRRYTGVEVTDSRGDISTLIVARFAQSLFGPSAWFSIASRVDPEIAFAGRFWDEAASLPGAPGL